MPPTFHNRNLRFTNPAALAAWLRTAPRPAWAPIGSTYHNTYKPNERTWAGHESMRSMQRHYEGQDPPWDRGPHVYIALGTAHDGLYVMTPPWLPGTHAGDCNDERFGLEVVGDFNARPMSTAQLELLAETAAVLHRWAGCGPDIVAHRDCIRGRTCPGEAAYAQKARIQSELRARLTLPPVMHGLVLTNAPMARIKESITAGRYNALKVVTRWGLGRAWTDWERKELLSLAPNVLVRTWAGDPSANKPFPHWEEVLIELQPWIAAGAKLVEIGNEPDAPWKDKGTYLSPAGYAHHLNLAREKVKRAWPHVKVVSPGLISGEGDEARRAASWVSDKDFADAVRACDYVGVHIYEHTTFSGAGHTNKVDEAERLYARFGQQPRIITEYGINHHPDGSKYARFVRGLKPPYAGAFAYHLSITPGADYQLGLDGDRAYGEAHAPAL